MNDRFKFRFYDEKNNFMITDEDSDENWNKCIELYDKDEWYFCVEKNLTFVLDYFDDKDFVVMQCTGLKDKNGKLIYEGDIIYSPSWWWGACFVHLNIGECGPCKGDSVMSYILAKNIDKPLEGAIYNIWNGSEVEVIGNIYENKELLNDH